MTLRANSKNNPRVTNHLSSTCGVDLSSKPCHFLAHTLVFSLTSWATFLSSGRPPRTPAPGAMLGTGVDDMEWGVMPARPDLGGKPEPGPAEGAAWVGGYGFTAGYVCGWGVSGGLAGGRLTFIVAWRGKEG